MIRRPLVGAAHWLVMVGRVLPTIRSIISIPAGALNMRLKSFLIWSTIGRRFAANAAAPARLLALPSAWAVPVDHRVQVDRRRGADEGRHVEEGKRE